MCPGGGDGRGLVRHPADLVPRGLPPGGGLCGRPPAIGCGWRSALDVRVAFSVEGLLTTGICPLAGAGLATILTMRFVGRTASSATGYGTLPSPAWPRSASRRRRPWVC